MALPITDFPVIELRECGYYTTEFIVKDKEVYEDKKCKEIRIELHCHTIEQISECIRDTIKMFNHNIEDIQLGQITVKASPELIGRLSKINLANPNDTILRMFASVGIKIVK